MGGSTSPESGTGRVRPERFVQALLPLLLAAALVALTYGVQVSTGLDRESVRLLDKDTVKRLKTFNEAQRKAALRDEIERNTPDRVREIVPHIAWGLSTLTLCLVLVGATAASLWFVFRPPDAYDPTSRRLLLWGAIGGLAGLAAVLVISETVAGPAAFEEIPRDVIPVLTGVDVGSITTPAGTLGGVAVVSLLLASCSLLLPEFSSSAQRLARAMRRLRALFYWGAACCVAAVFEVLALFRWPAAHLDPGSEARDALVDLSLAYSSAAGVLFALLLVAVYLPPALLLQTRARAMGERLAEEGDARVTARDEWMRTRGLTVSWPQLVNQLLAAVGPALAGGPVAALLTHLLESSSP